MKVNRGLLFVVITLLVIANITYANPPARQGPATLLEQETILKQGQENFKLGQYAEAARLLQRFVDRYPASAGYLEAHKTLGESYLFLNQPSQALKPLRYYVDAKKWSAAGFHGRVSLGRAYLKANKFHEGLLISNEIVKPMIRNPVIPPGVQLEGLLLKSWSFLGLKKDLDALKAVDAFFSQSKSYPPSFAA